MRRALLVVHQTDENGAPVVSEDWTVSPWGTTGWFEVQAPGGQRFQWFKENERSGTALFAVFGAPEDLQRLDSRVARAEPPRTSWRLRRPALRNWRTWVVSGMERDERGDPIAITEQRRVLCPVGAQLPDWTVDALPWNLDAKGQLTTQANAVIRVTEMHRPSMAITIAGDSSDRRFEDEPDDTAITDGLRDLRGR